MIAATSGIVNLLKTDWIFCTQASKAYRQERLGHIAGELAKELAAHERMKTREAQNNPLLLTARKFCKDLGFKDPRITECSKQILAMKFGIDADVFDHNKGFQEFASKYVLERYIMEYGHELQIDGTTRKIKILFENQFLAWEEAHEKISAFVPPAVTPKQPWMYGAQGIQNKDMYDWSELVPFKKVEPTWGNRYIFEFCACCTDSPQKTGDHSWIRLKTPVGDIYSVGLYRPEKVAGDNFRSPLRLKEGYLMQPDVSEFWPCDIYTIPFEITEEQFKAMKLQIETDKKEDKQIFQLLHSNCVLYTKKIARIAEIEVPTASSVLRLLFPKKIVWLADCVGVIIPEFIKKICRIVIGFFIGLVFLAFGAGKVDEAVRRKFGDDIQPHIASFWDLFNPSKMELHHPHVLGTDTRKWVEKWREKEIEKLKKQQVDAGGNEQIDLEIEKISYSIPR